MRGAGSSGAVRRGCISGGLLGLCLMGCLRMGYDVLSEPDPIGGPLDELAATSVEARSSRLDAGRDTTPLAPTGSLLWRPPGDRLLVSRDAGGPTPWSLTADDAGVDGGGSATTTQPCVLSGNEQVVSGFDGPTAGLEAHGPGTPSLTWTGAEGSPNPGALEFSNTTPGGGELYYPGLLGDLRSRRMSLNVRVAEGAGTRVRLFIESGPQRRRARASFITLPVAQWGCALVDPSNPASAEAGFDPADIVGAGLEIEASANVRVYADQIAY
ncbi:MAG: hypothetical protein RL033_4498 [Pseudomonadota bacterium]